MDLQVIVGLAATLFTVIVSFVQIGLGAAGLNECPMEPMIPKWLIGE